MIDENKSVSCWSCQFCDKVYVLVKDKWVQTRTGHCLAQKSAANGESDFYRKVYIDTVQKQCKQFQPSNPAQPQNLKT